MCKSIEINQNGKHLFSCLCKYTKWLLWLIFPSHQELGSTLFPSEHSFVVQWTRDKIHLSFRLSAFFPVNLPLVKFLNISWFLQLLPFTICVVSGVFILLYKVLEVLQNSWGMSGSQKREMGMRNDTGWEEDPWAGEVHPHIIAAAMWAGASLGWIWTVQWNWCIKIHLWPSLGKILSLYLREVSCEWVNRAYFLWTCFLLGSLQFSCGWVFIAFVQADLGMRTFHVHKFPVPFHELHLVLEQLNAVNGQEFRSTTCIQSPTIVSDRWVQPRGCLGLHLGMYLCIPELRSITI